MPDTSPPSTRRTRLSGWGRTAATMATVTAPTSPADVISAVRTTGSRGLIARGLGRSYGDPAQNAGGTVLDVTGLSEPLALDAERGVVDVSAGTSVDALLRDVVPRGWFVPVTPGTRFVTVGGALAADVHGKNHHRDGAFAAHVRSVDLVDGRGEVRQVGPADDPALFWATAGGMGLTGIVLRVRLQLVPIETTVMTVDTESADDLDAVMAALSSSDQHHRYTVAWLDTSARGGSLGRGVVSRGDHTPLSDLPQGRRAHPLDFHPRQAGLVPPGLPVAAVNRLTVRAFNEVWFKKAPRRQSGVLQGLSGFFHPLDGVAHWNRAYGPTGIVQYQFVVPLDRDDIVRTTLLRLQAVGAPSFLTVLKRLGAASPSPIGFPRPGWTLAVDVPADVPGLAQVLDDLDVEVATAGGALYLAKDARMRAELVPTMYPRLDEWRAARARVDPDGVFCSDQARRLRL